MLFTNIAGLRHQPPAESQNPQLLMAQQALRGNIQEGMAVAQETEGNLHSAASLPPLGSDSVRHWRGRRERRERGERGERGERRERGELDRGMMAVLSAGIGEVEADDTGRVSAERELCSGRHAGSDCLRHHAHWSRADRHQLHGTGVLRHHHVG